ncbi:MAG: SpoIIE family protein phosphatase [Bacteroidales bacterium]|nr:SpoIIE family protein phosphatase [Bacteroidales bacterium]
MLKKIITYAVFLLLPHICTAETHNKQTQSSDINIVTITLCVLTTATTFFGVYMYQKQYKNHKLLKLKTKLLERKSRQLSKKTHELEKNCHEMEKLSIVAQLTDTVIVLSDPEGKITWINEAFVKHSGFKIEDYLEINDRSVFKAAARNIDLKSYYEKIKETKHSVSFSTPISNLKGNGWMQAELTPTFDKDGNITQIIAVYSDITELKKAQNKIEQQNAEIQQSLDYAKKIQDAIKPMKIFVDTVLNGYFIVNMPKNTVSGDFYWVDYRKGCTLIALADCTGHGIPGGFMSMLGQVTLSDVIAKSDILKPSAILNEVRTRTIKLLHQRGKIGEPQDGMDMSLCIINHREKILSFAGAYSFTYLVRKDIPNEEIVKLTKEGHAKLNFPREKNSFLMYFKPDRMPIGIHSKENIPFSQTDIKFQKGDTIYMTTDGFADQFGGNNCKKLHSSAVERIFLKINSLPLSKQKNELETFITNWKGNNDQVDDILIFAAEL